LPPALTIGSIVKAWPGFITCDVMSHHETFSTTTTASIQFY
jgi:hypothetical protein